MADKAAAERRPPTRKSAALIAEVALVAAAYIALARISVASLDVSPLLANFLTAREAAVGGVFLIGALAQLLFVLAMSSIPAATDFRRAIRSSWQRAPREAWIIAMVAAVIQCATVAFFFIPDPAAIVELSARRALMPLLAVCDGWSQEVVFRGYLLLRLAKAGLPVWLQIAASAAAFASIHLGYIGSEGLGLWWPLIGTGTLGAFLALSVVAGKGSLLPAVTAHVLIILIVQPWLALAA